MKSKMSNIIRCIVCIFIILILFTIILRYSEFEEYSSSIIVVYLCSSAIEIVLLLCIAELLDLISNLSIQLYGINSFLCSKFDKNGENIKEYVSKSNPLNFQRTYSGNKEKAICEYVLETGCSYAEAKKIMDIAFESEDEPHE